MSEPADNAGISRDTELVQRAAEQLGEHFDTVQIFVSRHMPAEADGTFTTQWGVGNWFARAGQIAEWVNANEEHTREKVRRDFKEQ